MQAAYTPESKLRHPLRLVGEMSRDLLDAREIAWHVFLRDLRAYHRGSYLGVLWSFIPPLLMALVCTLASHSKVISFAATSVPYPAFVILGMVLWQIFTDSLNAPIQGVLVEAGTFTKVKIPPESMILARLHDVVFNAVIKLVLVLCVFAWFKLPLTIGLLLAPFAACSLILMGTLLGGMLAPISLLYDDFGRLLNLSLGYWFLITPVIYPAPKAGIFSWLVGFNPVTSLLVTTRELATGATLSCLPAFMLMTAFSIIGLMLSWLLFKLAMPFVVERKVS